MFQTARRAVWNNGQSQRYHPMGRTGFRCLFVGLLLGVPLGGACRSDHTKRLQAYLKRNSAVVPSAPDGTFKIPSGILDEGIDRYRVILTGERHGMAINYRLRLAFQAYLKQAVNIRYLLLELGPSQAGMLNRYLETGDTTLLDEMYGYCKGTYEWTQESYAFWESVYAFNSALPASKRLVCVGIDIEHQSRYALAYLKTLLPGDATPERITSQIDLVRSFSRDDATHFDIAAKLSADIKASTQDYRHHLREDFFEFRLIVESMVAARDAYRARQADGGRVAFQQLRERTMYTNFLQQYNRLPAGVYWGHFGDAHVFRKSSGNVEWLGVHLEGDDSPVTGRVLSISFAYEDCTAMIRRGGTYGTSSAQNALPGLFDFYEDSDPILFKLIGEGSPARFYQVVLHGEPGGSAEYFDYLLLIRGATPTVPLGSSDEQY
jgi:erythromycin esterase-like protein